MILNIGFSRSCWLNKNWGKPHALDNLVLVLVNISHISKTKMKNVYQFSHMYYICKILIGKKRIFLFTLFKTYFQRNLIKYLFSVPHVRIQGSPDLHVDRGSTINLTCVISHSPEPPAYIFWYLNDEVMAYDSPRYKLCTGYKIMFSFSH